MSFHKILVALDNSTLCPSVFLQALELAQSNSASLMLLNCISNEMVAEPAMPMSMEMGIYPGVANETYQTQHLLIQQRIDQAQALLKNYCEQATRQGVATELEYKVGEAGHCLCEVAQSWGADLIVVGRRGLKGIAEALLGSVSNHVMHHAPCSVLVIQELMSSEP